MVANFPNMANSDEDCLATNGRLRQRRQAKPRTAEEDAA
jgi:hypothetical protein